MDVKIRHVLRSEESAMHYNLQNPLVPDGESKDGMVITATIYNAPNKLDALKMANGSCFFRGLRSIDYKELGLGKIIR